MINAKIYIRFNQSVCSVDRGVDHLRMILATGSSRDICIQPLYGDFLCPSHSEVIIQVLEREEVNLGVTVDIQYPICLCGRDSGVSTFLGVLLYCTAFAFIVEYHILDFELSESDEVYELFQGPSFGVEGIRKLCNEYKEPLIGLILKPRTKIDLHVQSQTVERLVTSQLINYIIDDELVVSPYCSPYKDRIDSYSALCTKIKSQLGYNLLYWVNATSDIDISQEIINYALDKGINTFCLNSITMGFSAVKYIIDQNRGNAIFLVNNVGRGIYTRPPGFYVSEKVLSKLSRLCGADAVYTGPLTKEFPYDEKVLAEERKCLQQRWGEYKRSFAVSSGNIEGARNAKENIQALGKDTMIQMGSGLLGQGNVISKLRAFKFMVANALNIDIMNDLANAFLESEEMPSDKETLTMDSHAIRKRMDVLQTQLDKNLTLRIRLKDKVGYEQDPIKQQDYEDKLGFCEGQIIDGALQIAEYSINFPDYDVKVFLTSDVLQICREQILQMPIADTDILMQEIETFSKTLAKDQSLNKDEAEKVGEVISEISNHCTLEFTLPIIPMFLNLKSSVDLNTKTDFKKLIISFLHTIKRRFN